MKNKKQNLWKYSFAVVLILSGLILNFYNLGKEYLGFSSVGNWLIYVGFISLIITSLQFFSKKKRIVDERAEFIGMKASRVTYVGIILFAFIVMVLDGIKPINASYSYFMSYLICGIVLLYFISYKILERRN